MRKILGLVALFLILGTHLSIAQEQPVETKNWKTGGVGSLMFSQVTLTNWAAGGQNSFSLNTLFNACAYHKKESTSWDNVLDVA